MKLELKDLAPYLPYGLTFLSHKHRFKYGTKTVLIANGLSLNDDKNVVIEFLYDDELIFSNEMKTCTPILRSLSDLTEEQYAELDLNHNFSIVRFSDLEKDPTRYPYTIVQKLIEWHFDVFGLIEKGLAIDINTLEQ